MARTKKSLKERLEEAIENKEAVDAKVAKLKQEKLESDHANLISDLKDYIADCKLHSGNVTFKDENGERYTKQALYYAELSNSLTSIVEKYDDSDK